MVRVLSTSSEPIADRGPRKLQVVRKKHRRGVVPQSPRSIRQCLGLPPKPARTSPNRIGAKRVVAERLHDTRGMAGMLWIARRWLQTRLREGKGFPHVGKPWGMGASHSSGRVHGQGRGDHRPGHRVYRDAAAVPWPRARGTWKLAGSESQT